MAVSRIDVTTDHSPRVSSLADASASGVVSSSELTADFVDSEPSMGALAELRHERFQIGT
jgi:hypothetical protein